MIWKRRAQGFTLIEVLLAASLASVVGIAVYANLASGINMMRRVVETSPEEDLAIFFEKFERELQNSFHYKEIQFKGDPETFSFASRIISDPLLGGDEGIGRIAYYFNSSEKGIGRLEQNIHEVFDEREGSERTVLRDVSDLMFEYLGYDDTRSAYVWAEVWDPVERKGALPTAIKIKFIRKTETGSSVVTHHVLIPSAD